MPSDRPLTQIEFVRQRTPITVRVGDSLASFSRCRQEWANLVPTKLQSVRHCASCATDVHLVADLAGFEHAVAQGRCIAVSAEDRMYCGGEGGKLPYEAGGKLDMRHSVLYLSTAACECRLGSRDLGQDVRGCRGPDEWLGVCVVMDM